MNKLFIRNNTLRIIVITLIISLVRSDILYAASAGHSSLSPLYKALKAFQDVKQKEKLIKAELASAVKKRHDIGNRKNEKLEKLSMVGESADGRSLFEIIDKLRQKNHERDKYIPNRIPEELAKRKEKLERDYQTYYPRRDELGSYWEQLVQERKEVQQKIDFYHKERVEKYNRLSEEILALEKQRDLLYKKQEQAEKAIEDEIERLSKEWHEADKKTIPIEQELEKAEKAVSDAFEKYLEEMGKMPPPFLQSVSVYDSSRTYYKKQYTSTDLHAQANKVQEEMVTLEETIKTGEDSKKELSDKRIELTEELKPKIKRLNILANQYRDEVYNREVALAITELAFTATEIVLTGGTATLARKGEEAAAEIATEAAKKTFTVKGVKTGRFRKILNKEIIPESDWIKGADETRNEIMAYTAGSKATGQFVLPNLENKTAEIIVGETLEWAMESGAKTVHDMGADWRAGEGVRKNLRKNLVEGVKNRGTVFSIVNGLAKIVVKNAYDVEGYLERFWKLYAEIAVREKMRYELLKADKQISNKQKACLTRFELLKAQLHELNRTLKPETTKDEAVTDEKAHLTLSLEFSTNLTSPPTVKVAGLDILMKPEGPRDNSKVWKGTIDVEKLDNKKNNAPIVVSLKKNNRPYDALDSDPTTPAYAMLTRYKTWDELLNKKHWRGYEKGEDTNHKIKFDFNSITLRVITKTASNPPEADMDGGLQAYVAINGHLANKQELDTEKNDFEPGQTDTFNLKFKYPIKDIKFILLDVEGTDEWLCESIAFQFIKGEKKSRIYKYDENIWFSEEFKDKIKYHAIKAKEYKVNPYEDGLR